MSGGTYTLEDARRALAAVCGRTDAELLRIAGTGAEAERAAFVVPKVALLVAVATHLGVTSIRFVPATGGCAGIMALGTFAPLPPAAKAARAAYPMTGDNQNKSAACTDFDGAAGRAAAFTR